MGEENFVLQGEDGIRYGQVTEVRTFSFFFFAFFFSNLLFLFFVGGCEVRWRYEEGRVGKDGRSRWSPYH